MPLGPRILLVEDEPTIADTLEYAFRTEGFSHELSATGEDALTRLQTGDFNLVILDVGLPGISGFEVCRRLRTFSQVPVLFLTARQAEVDRVVGLEIGGDDYVTKPFSPREITARVRAILRRTQGAAASAAAASVVHAQTAASWTLDTERCRISYKGVALNLTRNEYRLLAVLMGKPGRVFTREALLEAAWTDPGASMDRTVDAHIKSLRAKIREVDEAADPIETHWGLGYSLKES